MKTIFCDHCSEQALARICNRLVGTWCFLRSAPVKLTIAHEIPYRIAYCDKHLINVVGKYLLAQEEYVQYMNAHVYGNPPLDVEESGDPELLKVYKQPAPQKPSLKCDVHEPGLVAVKDPSRLFCFGAAEVKGKRVCDRHVADYTVLHDTYVAGMGLNVHDAAHLVATGAQFWHSTQ